MHKKEQIIKWLKDRNIYEQFVKKCDFKELLLDRNLIAKGFMWDATLEGISFWSKIDEEYRDWYRKKFADEFLHIDDFDK